MFAQCGRCALPATVQVTADGQPADFDATFTPARLLAWFAAARAAMASGQPGVAIGACGACQWPLRISSRQEMSLPCPHCGEAVTGAAAQVIVDQWAEPWARVEGGATRLEYRLVLIEATTGLSAGCAVCGTPTPAQDPSNACARCGAMTWAPRSEGRVQLGVRVDGTRDGKPFKMVVSIAQGEAMLMSDVARGAASGSGTSFLGATGIGCAVVVSVIVVIVSAIWIAAHFSKC